MASSKKRTTMAKLAREQKLRERRAEKQARKDARRNGIADEDQHAAGPELDPAVTQVAPAEEALAESREGRDESD